MKQSCFLSIDIGSASLRTTLVSIGGNILATEKEPISTWLSENIMEQSSENIWHTLVTCTKRLLKQSNISPLLILGAGIDATASLVLLDKDLSPLSLSYAQSDHANIIGWMDHRAQKQAIELIRMLPDMDNQCRLSAEDHLPKLLWLKQEAPYTWEKCRVLDLSDYLTYRATGTLYQSSLSLLARLPIEILKSSGITPSKITMDRIDALSPVGRGLSKEASISLGLPAGLPMATSITDGYGGSLAVLLANQREQKQCDTDEICRCLSMIVGTSSIYISSSKTLKNITHAWGPTPSVIDSYFHNIVGQTAAGALLNHVTQSHPAFHSARYKAERKNQTVYQYLNDKLQSLAQKESSPLSTLTEHIHLLPYFAGNRTPWMDMTLTGVITGCTLDKSEKNLALIYLATIQALALEAKQNLNTLQHAGYKLKLLMPAGGLSRNPLYIQEHINAIGLAAALPEVADPMLHANSWCHNNSSSDKKLRLN